MFKILLLSYIFVTESYGLLCYNGTFSHKEYGNDPLFHTGIFVPSNKQMARIRCSLTTLCEVASLLCYNCTATHRDRLNCGGDFTPALQPFRNDRDLLVNCTGDDSMCFVRSWTARARYAWMVQRGCYRTSRGDPIPRAMTIPTRAMACKQERFADAEYKVCFCQADWCNTTTLLREKCLAVLILAFFTNLLSIMYGQ